MRSVDPRLRVLFVAAVAAGAFLLRDPRWLGLLAIANVALALASAHALASIVRSPR